MKRAATRLAPAAVAGVVLVGMAPAAHATSYSGYSLLQLRQHCMSYGQQLDPSGEFEIPSTQVSYGSTGFCAALVQELINDKSVICAEAGNGQPLQVDGQDGTLTTAAVKCFQSLVRLQVDGQVGPHTWSALWWVD